MIKIKKILKLYYISTNASNLTLLVDELKTKVNGKVELWDNGNFIGTIWNTNKVKTEGFTFEELE